MKLQLAFQGGGARLAVLLAAAEAIQELERKRVIEVTRIAGTSAGAIVGALLAAGCEIADLRTKLAAAEGEKLLAAFPPRKFLATLYKSWRGTPFWSDAPLAAWLAEQFRATPSQPVALKDLPKPLLVMSSDLEGGHGAQHGGDDNLVGALLTSAGLPFCFRTWKSAGNTVKVDGGLCENLPVNDLIAAEATAGRVVGFSFRESRPGRPDNVLRFGISLLDVAINHSVQSSRNRLGAGSVCLLEPADPISTFEFAKARAFLASNDYTAVKKGVLKWFEHLRERSEQPSKASTHFMPDVWCKPQSDDTHRQMERIGRIYRQQHLQQKFSYRSVKLLATANCLASQHHAAQGKADEVFYELAFQPPATPLFAHRLTLSSTVGNDFYGNYSVELFGPQGQRLPFELLASISPDSPTDRELVAHFLPPLAPGSGPYRLSMRDQGVGLLKGLLTQKEDGFGIGLQRAEGPIDCVCLGLHAPEPFDVIELRRTNTPVVALSKNELADTFGPTPLGYRTYGWVAKNVTALDYLELIFGI